MIQENLKKLGLSPSEIKIYLHLLKKGASYSSKISSEVKINRTNVYEALDRLISKGIISFITKNNLKWFEAKTPKSILTLINQKEEELKKTKKSIIEDIKHLPPINTESLEANIFTGKKGLRILFEDILDSKKEIFLIASNLQFKKLFGAYFELWHKERIERKIKQKSIFPIHFKNKLKTRKFLEYKFIDSNYINPTTTIVYGDSCLLIQWSENPVAIKIKNKEISRTHKNYFNELWRSAIQ